MSQTLEIQDSATLRERDRTIKLVEMGESRTLRRLFVCVRRCPLVSTFPAFTFYIVLSEFV
jgi:hypothetical protein